MSGTSLNIRRSGFTLTELAVVIVIIISFILLLTPFIKNIRSKAKILACEENIGKIGQAIRLYASEHDEKFPASLSELLQGGYIESERCFDCPSSPNVGTAKDPDYHYVTGYTVTSPSASAILFDKEESHREGRHVLYVSGNIEWLAGGVPK